MDETEIGRSRIEHARMHFRGQRSRKKIGIDQHLRAHAPDVAKQALLDPQMMRLEPGVDRLA